jgi:hypothetical protein
MVEQIVRGAEGAGLAKDHDGRALLQSMLLEARRDLVLSPFAPAQSKNRAGFMAATGAASLVNSVRLLRGPLESGRGEALDGGAALGHGRGAELIDKR